MASPSGPGERMVAAPPRAALAAPAVLPDECPNVQIDILSLFPSIASAALGESMMRRAQAKGIVQFRSLDLRDWNAEIAALIEGAYAAAPDVDEIDLWATVPLDAGKGVVVSGDLAKPTSATVFSITVPKADRRAFRERLAEGRGVFWDPAFRTSLAKGTGE